MKHKLLNKTILFFIGCSLCMFFSSCAFEKILMSNKPDKPKWIDSPEPNMFSVSAESSTAEGARASVERMARQKIAAKIGAIISNTTTPQNMDLIINVIARKTCSEQFFNNITLDNAADCFWKKISRADTIKYVYFGYFPLLKNQKDSLVNNWKVASVSALKTADSLSECFKKGYKSLKQLVHDYEVLKSLVEIPINEDSLHVFEILLFYKTSLDNCKIVSQQIASDKIKYRSEINGTPYSFGEKPSFEGCVKVEKLFNDTSNMWQTVTFSGSTCDVCNEQQNLKVKYDFENWSVSAEMPFSLVEHCVDFSVGGGVQNNYVKQKTGLFSSLEKQTICVNLVCDKPGKFMVNRIDYSYFRKGIFKVSTVTRSFESINFPIINSGQNKLYFTRETKENEPEESQGEYSGMLTIYYTDDYLKHPNKKQFENIALKVIK